MILQHPQPNRADCTTRHSYCRLLKWVTTEILLLLIAAITGCAEVADQIVQPEESDPGPAIESFLEALISKDSDQLYAAICPEWEAQAILEFDAFDAVEAELDGVDCNKTGTDGDYALVACTGAIILNYSGETRPMPLEQNTYRAKQHDGEWRMCGYD